MNIYEKMLAITNEMSTVAKNLTVGTGNNQYKAVSERDILDAVKPIEKKYGIYSYPYSRKVLESQLLEKESTYNGKTTKATTFMTRIETIYRFVDIECPESYIETIVFSEGIDSQDKGSGKAMTYADKYALMKAYKISTGEDPDQNPSNDEHYQKPGGKTATKTGSALLDKKIKEASAIVGVTSEVLLTKLEAKLGYKVSADNIDEAIKALDTLIANKRVDNL